MLIKIYLDCFPCFLRQALDGARLAGAGEWQQKAVIGRELDVLKQIGPGHTPPEIGDGVHRIERQEVGSEDPYRAIRGPAPFRRWLSTHG